MGYFFVLGATLALIGLVVGLREELRLAVDVGKVLAVAVSYEEESESSGRSIVDVTYRSRTGHLIPADLYVPTEDVDRPALIFVNGVEVTGRRHPLLMAIAARFAHAGFVVLAPEQQGNEQYRLMKSDPAALVAGFEFLATRPEVDPRRIAYFGVSTGGSLALVAAADPKIADRVSFVATLGSYYSLATLLQAVTTGAITEGGRTYPYEPHQYVWLSLIHI